MKEIMDNVLTSVGLQLSVVAGLLLTVGYIIYRSDPSGHHETVRQCVSQSVCHQNFGLITTTKGLNTSKRHSNNDNSEKTVHGVPEGG